MAILSSRQRGRRDPFTLDLDLFPEEKLPFELVNKLAEAGVYNLDPDLIQLRDYQAVATAVILGGKNFGLNMDTSSGKTIVFFLVADRKLKDGKVVLLAPQTALVSQHLTRARQRFTGICPEEINMVTGDTPVKRRAETYAKSRILVGTPQTFLRDLDRGLATLDGVVLVGLDEMHLAAERYAYIPIAARCKRLGIQILGMTASAGGTRGKIEKVKRNLHLDSWLRPHSRRWDYAKESKIVWVPLSTELLTAKSYLWALLRSIYDEMVASRITSETFPISSEKALKNIRGKILLDIKAAGDVYEQNPFYQSLSIWAAYYQVHRAIQILVGEGYSEFLRFSSDLKKRKGRTTARLLAEPLFMAALEVIASLVQNGTLHPKEKALLHEVAALSPSDRVIVFCRYIHSNVHLVQMLLKEGVAATSLIGKSKMPTKKQTRTISEFEAGIYKIMVSTSAGQMGLDIASVDTVIDYSVYQNGIEMIQRHGRGGRNGRGKVITLLMDDDSDRVRHYVALRQRATMIEVARADPGTMQAEVLETGQFVNSIQTSLFSGKTRKDKHWVSEIIPGDLVHERFLVVSVRIKSNRKYGPSVWIKLMDKTGIIRLFANCSDIVQAQRLAWRIPEGGVCIVIALAKNFQTETVLVADLKSSRAEHNIITCPEGDCDLEDYKAVSPVDDF